MGFELGGRVGRLPLIVDLLVLVTGLDPRHHEG